MTTTESSSLFLDCSALITAALLIFVPGNAFRDKGPAGHDERLQRPPASRFRFARDGDTKITGLSGESGRLVSIAPTCLRDDRSERNVALEKHDGLPHQLGLPACVLWAWHKPCCRT